MKKSNYLMLVLGFTFLLNPAYSQKSGLSLTFTAIDDAATVQLDSVKVMNRTQGGDTTIYWPNTVLVLDYIGGVHDIISNTVSLQVFQNYPNPVTNQSTISMYVPEKDEVGILITDVLGRVILKLNRVLERGFHSFRFTPSSGHLFFFTAQWRGMGSSIKILNAASDAGREASLEYQGGEPWTPQLKASKDIQSFMYNQGDTLLYVVYANGLQSGRLDTPSASQTYTLQFATNIPCPGTPEVEYEGEYYYTVQIFSQCWLKRNLNVGSMIPGSQEMTDNEVIEKYCYNDLEDNCYQYGGLYRWDELMQYNLQQGVQGICPPGWHLPTDEEWKVLEGAADSLYGIGDPNWDNEIYREYDAGLNLKNTYDWGSGSNGTDLFGFSGLPGGQYEYTGSFSYIGSSAWWWSSTESDINQAWSRRVFDQMQGTGRYSDFKDHSYSARCLMNETVIASPVVTTADITDIAQTSATGGGNVTDEGSSAIIERGVCWSTLQNPTISDPHTSDGSGIGSFTSNLTGLSGSTIYYVRAYAINNAGMAYGDEKTFTTVYSPFNCGDVINYQGEDYNTVQIGDQCWFKENLKTTTYNNGTPIPNVTDNMEWSSLTTGAYAWIDNDITWKDLYGALYNGYTVNDPNGLCPSGWHVPKNYDWSELTNFIGGSAGNELKSCRQVNSPLGGDCNTSDHPRWDQDNYQWGTDDYGFSALPGNNRDTDGTYYPPGTLGAWWASGDTLSSSEGSRLLANFTEYVTNSGFPKQRGFSVRCLQNKDLSSITTATIINIGQTTATSGGNVMDQGNSPVTARGVCWGTTQNPTISDPHTSDGSGTGSFTSNLTSLSANTIYYVRAYATNSVGTAYGNEKTFTTFSIFSCGDIVNYEDQDYNTLQIGDQCWFKENLNVGSAIAGNLSQTNNNQIEKYCYDNDPLNCDEYGGLYQWDETMQYTNQEGTQGICPSGWHIPTYEDWAALTGYLGGQAVAGGKMKEEGTLHWIPPNTGATNESGFTALPGGAKDEVNDFYSMGSYCRIWSSYEFEDSTAGDRHMNSYDIDCLVWITPKINALSVRCVKND